MNLFFCPLHRITWWLTHLEYENRPVTSALWKMMTWWNFLIWKVKMTSDRALADTTVIIPMGALTALEWKSTSWYMGKNPPCHQKSCISILINILFAFQIGDMTKERIMGKSFIYSVPMFSQVLFISCPLGDVLVEPREYHWSPQENNNRIPFSVFLVGGGGEISYLMDVSSDVWLNEMWRQSVGPSLCTVFYTIVGMKISKASSGTWLALLKMARQKSCRIIQVIINSLLFIFL